MRTGHSRSFFHTYTRKERSLEEVMTRLSSWRERAGEAGRWAPRWAATLRAGAMLTTHRPEMGSWWSLKSLSFSPWMVKRSSSLPAPSRTTCDPWAFRVPGLPAVSGRGKLAISCAFGGENNLDQRVWTAAGRWHTSVLLTASWVRWKRCDVMLRPCVILIPASKTLFLMLTQRELHDSRPWRGSDRSVTQHHVGLRSWLPPLALSHWRNATKWQQKGLRLSERGCSE